MEQTQSLVSDKSAVERRIKTTGVASLRDDLTRNGIKMKIMEQKLN